ncbi:PaaX family transcriptional regulator C-terminal domain-containing protein [Sulfitobacter sp. JB4-11]|uniref:PaaX family transcriptional regulator C-terminal domain-containing protein n=1 Tax=Sulfitobacter rhodophyticola TaxID=3238304 RepID=UPI003511E520
MPSDLDFIKATAGLRDLGGQRVWSLMISLFGDLAQDEGQAIDGPVLSAMMALLQVKPEATRVALHRLRNDGWVASKKAGRISRHSLTAQGRAECAAASPRIYADPGSAPTDWQFVLLEHSDSTTNAQMIDLGYIQVQPRLFAGPSDAVLPDGPLVLRANTAPHWLREQIAPDQLRRGYGDLLHVLETFEGMLPPEPMPSPLEVAVLRGLIVHNWRRLVLKHPPLPQPLVADDWPGRPCHHRIAALLDRFPRPALSEIEPRRDAA